MRLSSESDEFVLVTLARGKMALFMSEHEKWTMIEEPRLWYDDVVLFNDKFYAVENTITTVVVDP